MLLEVQWENCYWSGPFKVVDKISNVVYCGYTTLLLSSRNTCMCAFVWLPEQINVFSEIKVFKCFLCACAANDAGREVNGGLLQELTAKRLVYHMHKAGVYIAW